jgi:predicted S18 family serine protease
MKSVTFGRGRDPGKASSALEKTWVKPSSLPQSAPEAALQVKMSNERSAEKRFWLPVSASSSGQSPISGVVLHPPLSAALTWTSRTVTGSSPARSTVT